MPTQSISPTVRPSAPPGQGLALGAYLGGLPTAANIDAFTALVAAPPHFVMWYQQWDGSPAFPSAQADLVLNHGAMPILSWEPWAGNKIDATWSCSTIVDGSHDAYLDTWVAAVAAWGKPIYVRPMYEMNGNWTAWSPTINGNTPTSQINAWKHIVDHARSAGATNIRWIWAPNIDDGNAALTDYSALYPGDAYVDWLGLDGYNWGPLPSGNGWQTLTEVFETLGGSYSLITALSSKPLMISETASNEDGGDKAAWITSAFASELAAMPRIKAVTWFNAVKETDWRVNSSSPALAAYKIAAAANQGNLP